MSDDSSSVTQNAAGMAWSFDYLGWVCSTVTVRSPTIWKKEPYDKTLATWTADAVTAQR